jgi:hypothetical protein
LARSRNIKHGLYLNEELAELSIYARYLFPCLWCLCDKEGRMEYRPRKIKAESYPYDDVDIPALLVELHEKQFISVYGNGTRAYIQVNGWVKHQNPHPKEKASEFPSISAPDSKTATIESITGKEKQFNFTESNGSAVKFNLIPDSLPSDSKVSDSLPSDDKPCDDTARHTAPKDGKDESKTKRFIPPTPDEVGEYMLEIGYKGNPQQWCDHYQSNGWMVGKNKMKDWKAAVRTWRNNGFQHGRSPKETGRKAGIVEANAPDTDWLGNGG